MQLRKFYGRNMAGTLARVRQALGADALILETREITPGSPAERLNPGARIEIVAAREADMPVAAPSARPIAVPSADRAAALRKRLQELQGGRAADAKPIEPMKVAPMKPAKPALGPSRVAGLPRYALLADLAELKTQLNTLLDGSAAGTAMNEGGIDLTDYHALISLGIDHRVLAPHFRAWLQWRTAPTALRRYMEEQTIAATQMRGESLREWLLHVWSKKNADLSGMLGQLPTQGPVLTGLLGATGAGKSTTLAKLASIFRQKTRQKSVVVTLDTQRFGATEQWRKLGRLLEIDVHEVVTQEDLTRSMESWGNYGWVGIDTPGGMTPGSAAGTAYGRLLAQCPLLQTVLVVPATQHASLSQKQLRAGHDMGAKQVIFSKMDEGRAAAGALGTIVNLSLGESLGLAGLTTGTRVPEDFAAANAENLWRHVLAPNATLGAAA